MSSELESEIAGWLETLGPGAADTLQEAPGNTIVPRSRRDSRSERGLDLLRRLAGLDPNDARGEPPLALELGDEIARGGMGRIRVAQQVALGREVVVKSLRRELRDDFAATMELLREAWVTGALEHPSVIPVYDIALDAEGRPLIVLKRIEGVTWTQLMNDAAAVADRFGAVDLFDWNLEILLQVTNAVRFAHSRGILHRDLKPDNVMVGEFGEVYLVDWGIAAALEPDPSGRIPSAAEVAGRVAGTPAYLAPEALGADPPTVQTDVYGLGAILYEIICGEPPHPGDAVLEVLTSVASREPELPSSPVELVAICRRALARDPGDRYAGADELRLALAEFARHRDSTKLSDRAALRLDELSAHARSTAIPIDDKRQVLYNLLGECRFGFGAALAAWPDNQTARAGLRDAVCAVARFELETDNPAAAKALVAGVDDIPEEMTGAIDAALQARDDERRRFEALRFDDDPTVGNRTRTFLTAVLGTLWTVLPLAIEWLERTRNIATTGSSYFRMALITVGMIILIVGLSSWARASIFGTRLNRLLFFAMMATLSVQLAMLGGAYLMAFPPVETQVLLPLVWFAGAAMFATAGDVRALPLAGGYLAAFLLSAWSPEYRFYYMSAAHLVTMINALWLWRSLRAADTEPTSV